MKILFLTRLYYPHIGGVEKHIENLSKCLVSKGHEIVVLTEKCESGLVINEVINGVKIIRFSYPKIKLFGLFCIWFNLLKNISLIKKSDIVHCHDVFIWYLPFRFLFPFKKIYTTFHGWEGVYPISFKNIILKQLAAKLSFGTIAVGKYIEKYYKLKSNFITYGAVKSFDLKAKKRSFKNEILYVGRLEEDTGIKKLFDFLDKHKSYSVNFCGDGVLRNVCETYGKVHGFVDPTSYYRNASICFASGYLTALEGLAYKCKIMVGWSNALKKDYWKLSPFWQFVKSQKWNQAFSWTKSQNWEKVSDLYLKLWKEF